MTTIEKMQFLKSLIESHQYELEFRCYLVQNTTYLYNKVLFLVTLEEIVELLQELYYDYLEQNDTGRKSSLF